MSRETVAPAGGQPPVPAVIPQVRFTRAGPPGARAPEAAAPAALQLGEPIGRAGLAQLAFECLQGAGHAPSLATLQEDRFGIVLQGMQTTSDFPELLQVITHRLAVNAFMMTPPWIRQVGRLIRALDFREHAAVILGELGLKKLNESGEIEFAALPEKGERFMISTYAARSAWTRQLAVNDIDGSFERAITSPMASVNNLEANVALELLSANAALGPTMSDTKTLFHADHGNVDTAALGVPGLTAARSKMRAQKTLDGKNPINVGPKFLLVPAALETTAEKTLAEIYATKSDDVNPFTKKLELVVEPRLDAISVTAWYAFADPVQVPTVGYAYLQGKSGPMVELQPSWEQDGLGIRIIHDYGVVAEDWRGCFRSTGAG